MIVSVDKTTQVTLTMNTDELKQLLDCISELVTEKVDLKKYAPIFTIKDAIVDSEVNDSVFQP